MNEGQTNSAVIRPIKPQSGNVSDFNALGRLFQKMAESAGHVTDEGFVQTVDPFFAAYLKGLRHGWEIAADIMRRQTSQDAAVRPSSYYQELLLPIQSIIESFADVAKAKADSLAALGQPHIPTSDED